jgi:hypothetical protein
VEQKSIKLGHDFNDAIIKHDRRIFDKILADD